MASPPATDIYYFISFLSLLFALTYLEQLMTVTLSPQGAGWIRRSLAQPGEGTITELVGSYIATAPIGNIQSVEDVQVELSMLDSDAVEQAFRILVQRRFIKES